MLRVLLASFVAVALCASTASAAGAGVTNTLMPQPASLQVQDGAFVLSSNLTVSLSQTSSPRLQAAVLRALRRLEDRTGLPLPRTLNGGPGPTLLIAVQSEGDPVDSLGEDESYTLTTTPTSLRLEAPNTLGAIHGLETLLQLIQVRGSGYIIPAVRIQDAPRFHWRGLMIDCGRHFEPMDVLKRNIDAMAAVKLNVFHWHLTEDQGFRIESKRFPKLTQLGSDGLYYTQDEARDLVRYAHDRGIRVLPEFEMPAHSTAWLVAYPELSSGSVPSGIRREFGISEYVIDPTREETYRFIEQFLAEMTTIFPDQYLHIGGDEASAPDWRTNPRIIAFMKAHNLADRPALQAYFNQRLLAILNKLHRRMVGWDEVLNPALPHDVVIQSWRGTGALTKAAQGGYQGFLSAPYYLNMMQPAATHYLADPLPSDTPLTPDQQKLILGGEICMWAEQIDARSIDSRIWPRAAAIAERFWSPQSVRDVDDMYRRLLPVSRELETLGLQHLTHQDAALRDLAGTDQIKDLRTFASAVEPVGHDDRYKQQHTSQLTPLTSFVDAISPDPPTKHQLALTVHQLLEQPKSEAATQASQTLLNFFQQVADSVGRVQQQMLTAPRLQPLQERSVQLKALATIGQQAVSFLDRGELAPVGWKASSLQQIQAAKQPSAMVNFVFLDPLTELVSAVR